MVNFAHIAGWCLAQLSTYSQPTEISKPDPRPIYDFFEKHGPVLYPAMGIFVVLAMVLTVLASLKDQEISGLEKAKMKQALLDHLRAGVGGSTAEELAQAIHLDRLKAARLLEEMQADGLLQSYVNTQRLTVWQLKGVPQKRFTPQN